MKKIILILILSLTAILAYSQNQDSKENTLVYDEQALSRAETTKIMTNANYRPNYYMSVAHRAKISGYEEFPENSLSVIKNSIMLGVNILEIDLKISSDGYVYLMHDDYLQRTTNFLDIYPGTGTGQDSYGKCDSYSWNDTKNLLLKRSDFTCSEEKIPLFRDVLRYVKNNTQAILNLDINSEEVFSATWNIVKDENAFDIVVFKTRGATVTEFKQNYYDALSDANKAKLILFPIISAKIQNIPQYYQNWENSKIPKGYEISFRDNVSATDSILLNVVKSIRNTNRVRVHAFSTLPDNYKGRYKGNVNINQCCNNAFDRRGDWEFLLDPFIESGTEHGVNGSIITDDPILLDDFYISIDRHN